MDAEEGRTQRAAPDLVVVDERYIVRSGREIAAIVQALATRRELVTIYFDAREFIVSMVLEVDAEAGYAVLDCGADPRANARLLRAAQLVVVSQLAHIRVQFACGPAETVRWQDGAALRIPLPDSLVRLQRRDAYRVRLPVSRGLRCEVPAEVHDPRGPCLAAARVIDISCGGLHLADLPLALPWQPGALHTGCHLTLPEIGTLLVDVQVVRMCHAPAVAGIRGRHVGAHFVELREGARASIQRFINEVQRAQNRLKLVPS